MTIKCLFVGPRSPDHLASCLWDGLQEILGEENVVDAVDSPWLHKSSLEKLVAEQAQGERQLDFPLILQSICGSREGMWHGHYDRYDLLVLSSLFNRDHDWSWFWAKMEGRLRIGGKVAYIEGWDAAWQIHKPECKVDAVFRKEISPSVSYPYAPHHLTFAAPERWFESSNHRPYDVVFIGNPNSAHPEHLDLRWRMMAETFRTRYRHSSVLCSRGIGYEKYFDLLRSAKLALCPTAADSADSLRTYEAVACGAIPVFIGYPNYIREPWFDGHCSISCTVDTLAEHIDNALSHDLEPMRARLREKALAYHTTKARALKVLNTLGFKEGVDW